MSNKKMPSQKQEKWVKAGAPAEALDFLGSAVEELSKNAIEGNIMYKSVDDVEAGTVVSEGVVVPDLDAVVGNDEVEQTPVVEEIAAPVEGLPVGEVPVQKSVAPDFSAVLADTVARMIKEYHTTIVEPLVKELTLVKAKAEVAEKTTSNQSLFSGSDFLPPSAIAAAFKKEFNIFDDSAKGDVVMEKGKAQKLDSLVVDAGDVIETQSNHLLADI